MNTDSNVVTGEDRRPLGRAVNKDLGEAVSWKIGGIEAALRTRALEHPGPVLRVGCERHARLLLFVQLGVAGASSKEPQKGSPESAEVAAAVACLVVVDTRSVDATA
jgi:hypothetical protein